MNLKQTASQTEAKAGHQPFNQISPSKVRGIHADRSLIPKYWTGKSALDPRTFSIDLRSISRDLKHEITEGHHASDHVHLNKSHDTYLKLQNKMQDLFTKYGLVYLHGNETMQGYDEMAALVSILFPNSMAYEGGSNYRGRLDKNVYDTGAPRHANLHYHHEMAYVSESPEYLSFLCLEAPPRPEIGATFVSDNKRATEMLLESSLGQRLKEKGLCYVRKLPDLDFFKDKDPSTVYNYWQTSFQCETPEEATEKAKQKGLQVEWEDSPIFGRYMVTKFYVSAFEYCPYTQKNLLYASVADDSLWFDSWPGLMSLEQKDRPLQLNFGDDEALSKADKAKFIEVYDNFGIPIFWSKGDIAIVCNYRFAHGRPSYTLEKGEKRELGVILGQTFKRIGPKENSW